LLKIVVTPKRIVSFDHGKDDEYQAATQGH
jgi:hypothetical protein